MLPKFFFSLCWPIFNFFLVVLQSGFSFIFALHLLQFTRVYFAGKVFLVIGNYAIRPMFKNHWKRKEVWRLVVEKRGTAVNFERYSYSSFRIPELEQLMRTSRYTLASSIAVLPNTTSLGKRLLFLNLEPVLNAYRAIATWPDSTRPYTKAELACKLLWNEKVNNENKRLFKYPFIFSIIRNEDAGVLANQVF